MASALEAQERHEYEQAGVYDTNKLIERHNTWARALYGISGAALATGDAAPVVAVAHRRRPTPVAVGVSHGGGGETVFEWTGRF